VSTPRESTQPTAAPEPSDTTGSSGPAKPPAKLPDLAKSPNPTAAPNPAKSPDLAEAPDPAESGAASRLSATRGTRPEAARPVMAARLVSRRASPLGASALTVRAVARPLCRRDVAADDGDEAEGAEGAEGAERPGGRPPGRDRVAPPSTVSLV